MGNMVQRVFPFRTFFVARLKQSVDTGAGLVTFDTPVTVATVVADTAAHASGVQVFPFYGPPLYQVIF